MNRAFAVNPYQSPTCDDLPVPASVPSGSWLAFAARGGTYLLCGALIFVAFCTPLNVAQEMFWRNGQPQWISLACVLASTLVSGLLLDGFIRSEWHCLLVGFAWTMTNAVLFAIFIMLGFDGPSNHFRPDLLLAITMLGITFGPVYGILCMHLALPVSALSIWLARKMGE